MRLSYVLARTVALALSTVALSSGAIIWDSGVTALGIGDPTTLGRISRNGVISDWSTAKPFPGVINTATSYRYHVYDILIPFFNYIQISIDDSINTNVFASAYLSVYDPNNKATNYLGDAGGSGNLAGNPRAFQVIMPSTPGHLEIVINDSSAAGAGVGNPYEILVEGFSDTQFNENTPEPASLGLTAGGLGFALWLVARRRQHSTAA